MRLRSFTAESMPAAFALVKAELGDDAIILSTEEKKGGVHVTAAIEPDNSSPHRGEAGREASTPGQSKPAPTPTLPLWGREPDQLRYDVQSALRFHNVPELFIAKLGAQLNDAAIANILGQGRMNIANESRHFLKLALEHICGKFFRFAPPPEAPHRLMLAGAPGIGKTLAIAKLATRYTLAREKTVVITTDTARAGGAEQLKSFTDILDVPMTVCGDKKSLAAAVRQAGKEAHLLIDTAGCNPYEEEAVLQLGELAAASGAPLALVMPAGMDAAEAIDAAEPFMALPIVSLMATRIDCTRRFGGLLAVAAAHRLPFGLESGSNSVADPVAALSAKTLVQHLMKPL